MTDRQLIEIEALTHGYQGRDREVTALGGVDLSISRGEFLVIRGPSGSGKTTLLLILGGMLRPTGGNVYFDGADLYRAPESVRREVRARHLGFVFQTMYLLPFLSAVDNVSLTRRLPGLREARNQAVLELNRMGLSDRLSHRPSELSAGERQRVAMARALAGGPDLILADEPTGNLDPASAGKTLGGLTEFHASGGTVVLVTHEAELPVTPDRELVLEAGQLVGN